MCHGRYYGSEGDIRFIDFLKSIEPSMGTVVPRGHSFEHRFLKS